MVSYSIYESDNRVRRYAETLMKSGYSVDAISLRRPGRPPYAEIGGVRVFGIQKRIKNEKHKITYLFKLVLFCLRSLYTLARNHIKAPYDLVHVHSVPDFEIFAALLPKLTGSKIILDIHDIVPEFYASKFGTPTSSLVFKLLIAIERMSAKFSDHVIVSNHIWHARLQGRSVEPGKLTTILNFPDTQVFCRRGKSRSDGRFIMLYPGTLNYHQGVDIAIRAFSRIRDAAPFAEFHIYGSGEQLEFLKSLIFELGLQKRVFHKGSLALDKMALVMENADLGVVPKRKTGFGNEAFSTKILEFMCLGVPVIVPDTLIDTRYFNNSVVKFFSGDDEQSLAAAMLLLIENSNVRDCLARTASHFIKQYEWDKHEYEYLELVDRLIGAKTASCPT